MHEMSNHNKNLVRKTNIDVLILPPATKLLEGNVFTGVCLSTGGGMMSLLV